MSKDTRYLEDDYYITREQQREINRTVDSTCLTMLLGLVVVALLICLLINGAI